MLPIRWIFPVGCVFLTAVLMALALGLRSEVGKVASAQIELGERPEWRQFVILSAIQRRADELNSLRQLPDTPPRTDDVAGPPKVSLPADRSPEPKDSHETAANVQPLTAPAEEYPVAAAPVEIAESMSIEYPVAAAPEQKPPTDRTPQRVKPRARMKSVQHVRHRARPLANREPPRVQNVFEFPFGNQAPTPSSNNYFGNQQAGQTTPAEKRLQATQVTRATKKAIVSKKVVAPYRSGPSKTWIKVKDPKVPAATPAMDGTF
jgi:hypothetical protein